MEPVIPLDTFPSSHPPPTLALNLTKQLRYQKFHGRMRRRVEWGVGAGNETNVQIT
jgi:hypothetical protein